MRGLGRAALIAIVLASCGYDFDARFGTASSLPDGSTGDAQPSGPDGGGCGAAGSALRARLPESSGVARHLAPNGSDSASGSREAPWLSLQKAFDTLAPGESVLLHGGTYSAPATFAGAGSAEAPITVRAADGEVVVVRGVVTVTGSFLRIAGLVFDGPVAPLIIDGSDVEVAACEVRNASQTGIRIGTSASRITVLASWVHDLEGRGIAVTGGTDAVVAGNLVHDSVAIGILVTGSAAGTVVTNNTSVRNEFGVFLGPDVTGTLIINNILAFNRQAGASSSVPSSPTPGNTARTNLVFGNPEDAIHAIPTTEMLEVDPGFVDSATNLRLRSDSPGVSRASAEYAPAVARDGACRPLGAGPDLGAFEL